MSFLGACCANLQQRWIFAVMCFFALFNAYAMRACLSIAITKMAKPVAEDFGSDESCPADDFALGVANATNATIDGGVGGQDYDWDEYTQGLILSSFFWGYIFTHLPGGLIADRYGGKHTLGIGILLTALFTIATPLTVYYGDWLGLIILRVLMGLGEGTTYPAINVLLAKWAPPEERSRTASFVYAGALIGTIYATTVSGVILQYAVNGWPIVFYVMGATSIAWYVIWCFVCYNSPTEHPFISDIEVNFIKERMGDSLSEKNLRVPWRHILGSGPLWAVIVGLVGYNWSILTIITDLPKYMSSVMKFSVQYNGYLTSLIYLCMWLGGMVSSWIADYLIGRKIMATTQVRKYGSVLALTGSSCLIIAASYAGCDKTLVVTMFVLAMTIMGSAFPTVMVNALDLSPNYAGTLMALTNGLSALTGIAGPYIIGVLAPHQTLGEWRLVFWILFGVSVVSNVIFLAFGDGEVQYWNDPDFKVKNAKAKSSDRRTEEKVRV
ncbi:hypothetical protein TKK_0012293 [Trichogramma kaykai]|uniref:Major facilitator superfamily (MFS) profile domain-containing protein n=1 Tax=Trichogramma kaykai TaxID=54128 RepID=A0ABD2WNJ2_9HYME